MATGQLQHRRAVPSSLSAIIPAAGELFLDTVSVKPRFGDSVTTGGVLTDGNRVNAQTGISYTVLSTDVGKLVTFSNSSSVAVSLDEANSAGGDYFPDQSRFSVLNLGTGVVTITPATSTINGLSTLSLSQYEFAIISSDGSNYLALVGSSSSSLRTVTKTATYTLLTSDSGKHFNNIGATGDIEFNLPPAAADLLYAFAVDAAFYIRVNAGGSDTISTGVDTSGGGGYIRSNIDGCYLVLVSHGPGKWKAMSITGDWGVDV